VVPGELHTEVSRKPVGALDQDDAHAVAGNPIEHGLEARSLGHRVGSAHRRVVELADEAVAVRLGERRDGRALPLVAVLVTPDVCSRRGPQISNRVYPLASHRYSTIRSVSLRRNSTGGRWCKPFSIERRDRRPRGQPTCLRTLIRYL